MKHFILLIILLQVTITTAQDFRFGKVSKEEIIEKQHPRDPNAHAAILYKEEKTEIVYDQAEGFKLNTDVFYRIKIYSTAGFNWGTQTIELAKVNSTQEKVSGLKAVTYNIEGNKIDETKLRNDGIFKEEKSDYQDLKKFTMPNLKEGSVIEFKYKLVSDFFTDINTVRLQETIPINSLEVAFTTPEYFGYKLQQRGYLPVNVSQSQGSGEISYTTKTRSRTSKGLGSPVKTTFDTQRIKYSTTIYKVQETNIPAIKKEVYAGNMDNYTSSLEYELQYTKFPEEPIEYYTTTWEDVSKTIYNSENFGAQIEKTNYFEDDLSNILNGVTTNEEKTAAIYTFVRNKMTWDNYIGIYTKEGVKKAFKSGTGNTADINLLLVAMLREANINANPVLVSTVSHGIPLFPTRSGFNYVICAVGIGDNITLLDATRKNTPLGLLDEDILNWQGRLIKENGESQWVNLYPNEASQENTIMQLAFNEDMSLSGSTKNSYTDLIAYNMLKKNDLRNEEALRNYIETTYPSIEASNLNIVVESIEKPIKIDYDFKCIETVDAIGGKYYFNPLQHLSTLENPFKSDTREFPIVYNYPRKSRNIVSIIIPDGLKVESMPESTSFSLPNNLGKYTFKVSNQNGTVQVYSELLINTPVVAPQNYPELKNFYNFVVEKESEKLVLSKE